MESKQKQEQEELSAVVVNEELAA